MFFKVRSFCIQRYPIRRFQTFSSHYRSSKKPEIAKQPPTESVCKYRHKFGNDWTYYDLDSYNISINHVDPLQFFGLQELPEPAVDEELLKFTEPDAMQQVRHAQLINLLDLATTLQEPELETAVRDFSVKLFDVLGYVSRDRVARTRMDLPLFVSNEDAVAKADVCIIDRLSQDDILLVVHEERYGSIGARAQLIADGVAAFYENNYHRENIGLPYLENKVMPGIVMEGTLPTFFKIPVSQNLLFYISCGIRPPEETRVTYCFPPVPAHRHIEGMKPLDNRREILKCFEAFKAIVGI